ncbi:hypothetical protein Fmac_006485 [Flemingia macrophylla]|uniref:BTB domain-containing protein n=1 Tax=Flemingia macrophylla TaxID=520843 RepID=A0ABD1NDF4_9FABA
MEVEDEHIILLCTNNETETEISETLDDEILVSTTDILAWDFPTILTFPTIKIQAHRNSLIQQSLYFRGLLAGSFSESCLGSITINWNVETFLLILKHMCSCGLDITLDNFLPLYEGALYFGVETLLLNCETWLSGAFSPEGFQSTQIQLEDLVQIWKFGSDRVSDFILQLCMGYLARNFMWAKHSKFFGKLPYDLLFCSVKHPHLTVDSELHLSDALLLWLESNLENFERPTKAEDDCNGILKQIHLGLLPLWFALGKRNSLYFRQLAEESLDSIFRLLNIDPMGLLDTFEYSDLHHLRIRLTEFSKIVNLSGCPQITTTILLLSLMPQSSLTDPMRKKIIKQLSINCGCGDPIRDNCVLPQNLSKTLTFEAVQEVDISKCRNLFIEHAVDWFRKSFPSLRILKAAYLLKIGTIRFLQLLGTCPMVCEIDLTVDITPLVPALVTVLSSSSGVVPQVPEKTSNVGYEEVKIVLFNKFGPPLSNVTKLTLEGRTDVSDFVLHYISRFCGSLHHLNIKGCISVTDIGISDLIFTCRKLNSIVVCDTSFGINSVQALCSAISDRGNFPSLHSRDRLLNSVVSNFEMLHLGGCRGVCESSLLDLMSQTQALKSLCLRGTNLVDQALYNFVGSSLEMLDVSNTKISGAALAYVIHGNPLLKSLKARDCQNLFHGDNCVEKRESSFSSFHEKVNAELGKLCRLEEIEFGWGFSSFSLSAFEPTLMSLKTINIGLGGMLGEDALKRLPAICPLLETIILHFQVISDIVVMNFVTALKNLQELALCYCFGDISMSSFKFPMKNLTRLRLERVTQWMTNDDLVVLTKNCRNLVVLSLLGCPLLDPDSLQIISCGWPGLVSIHLEDCGEATANGASALLECKALEDILLRHNGSGLHRNFIGYAASEIPLLRRLSLDICDASEGDFDIPTYAGRYFLSTLKIARCKSKGCALNLQAPAPRSRRGSVHAETLVLVWDSKNLIRTVVKERL